MKFRSLLLAAGGVVGTFSVAAAQPAPQPAPVPLAPAVAPADSGASAVAEPTPLPWRGSTFIWNQAGTTTLFGIGRDNIGGEDEYYGWDFTFQPVYYLYDTPRDKVAALAEIGWTTELTNSNTTADRRETQFKDMQVGARYTRAIWESPDGGEYVTTGNASLRLVLPTSPTSYDQGKYFTVALGPEIKQQIKLLGRKADGFNHVAVGLGLTYAHLFSRATTPTNSDLEIPTQNASGQAITSDQVDSYSFDIDRLTMRLTVDVPLYKQLTLRTAGRLIEHWTHEWEDSVEFTDATGTTKPTGDWSDSPTRFTSTVFDVALNYPIYKVVDLTLGYSNENNQLGEDGEWRNPFYSSAAQFYLDITAHLDEIYTKVTRRDQSKASASSKRPAKTEF